MLQRWERDRRHKHWHGVENECVCCPFLTYHGSSVLWEWQEGGQRQHRRSESWAGLFCFVVSNVKRPPWEVCDIFLIGLCHSSVCTILFMLSVPFRLCCSQRSSRLLIGQSTQFLWSINGMYSMVWHHRLSWGLVLCFNCLETDRKSRLACHWPVYTDAVLAKQTYPLHH